MNAQNLSVCIEFVTNDGIQLIGLSNINESLSTHHIVYKIHNLENGKHYIGQHTIDNPFDSYMGSGKLIQKSLLIHPLSVFVKEILFDFETFDQMNQKEQELVPLSSCCPNDPMSYNLKEGGLQGQHTEQSLQKLSLALKNKYANMTKEERNRICEAHKDAWKDKTLEERHAHGQKIKAHWDSLSKEEKEAYSSKMSELNSGENNPMYSHSCTEFMTNEEIAQWKSNIGKASHKMWKQPTYREKVLALTLLNPNIDHDCRKYMTDEEIKSWKASLSKATSGKNNPMYGKSSWEKCTPEQRADRARRYSQNMKGKNKGKRCMKLPNESHWKFVNQQDVQKYLDMGYEFYSRNKGKKFKK